MITIEDVRKAATLLAGHIVATPFVRSRTLSQLAGADVILKFENQQFTGSFKDRGARVKLASLSPAERQRGVVAMSAGNHAQAVAYHAQQLGVPATIVMPRFTPNVKVRRTQVLGARVVLHGAVLAEARAHAEELAHEHGYVMVHPYDDERVIAGQGTVALEMLAQAPDLDSIVVPIGGGGLIAGCAVVAQALRPRLQIIGVQTERYPAVHQALAGAPIECGGATMAEGIAVKEPGRLTLPLIRELVRDVILVDEDAIESAVLLLLDLEKSVVEGAGAAGLAAVLREKQRFAGQRVGVVLSGGNIDLLVLSSIIQRGLARTGRMVRLRIGMPDRPGSLSAVSQVLAQANANVVEVHHQRAFSELTIEAVLVEFVVETLGHEHLREILAALRAAGFSATLPDREMVERSIVV